MKKTLSLILALILCFLLAACGDSNENNPASQADSQSSDTQTERNETDLSEYNTTNPVVAMEVEGYGTIVIELYPDMAPNTVNNFISLVKKGFYDNNTIHRVQTSFVIQGGSPTASGNGGPGYTIPGEFASNGVNNTLSHSKGVISMARSTSPDSAGSQFFIMLTDNDGLDGSYAAFGKVIDGFEVCQNIEARVGIRTNMGMLNKPIKIKKTVVDTKGKEYPEPIKTK